MYPEVHTLSGGVEAQGTPDATMAHCILLEPYHQKGNPRSPKGPLKVVTCTSLGRFPQLK
jgi:hypothetical protein